MFDEAPEHPGGGEVVAPCCPPAVDPRIVRRFDDIATEWIAGASLPDLVRASACLLALLERDAGDGPSVLELGSGGGALAVALLERGALRVTGIDLSQASVEVARRRADGAGVSSRARFEVGNAAEADLEPHDWVILDRVVCCLADVDGMLDRALENARRRIALSVPESRGWRGWVNRPVWRAETMWDVARGGCPGYVHDIDRMEARLERGGFRRVAAAHARLWYAGVYERRRGR